MTDVLTALVLFDQNVFTFLNNAFSNQLLNYFFVTITDGTFWIIPGLAAAALFYANQKNKALIIIGLALITVAISDPVSSHIIKPLVARHRPCHPDFLIPGTHMLLGFKTSASFPSSHAANMFAQAMLLTFFYPKRWFIFFSFAGVIGFSRIYVGVHFPLDVMSGAILGILVGNLVYFSYKRMSSFASGIKKNSYVTP